jgi:hypothetical protein
VTETTGKGGIIGRCGNVLPVPTGLFLIHTRDGIYDVEDTKFMCSGR